MRRREFIAAVGAAALGPLAARAQPRQTLPRIGYLAPTRTDHVVEAFRKGLRDLGYSEGENVLVEYRFADNRPERIEELATEMSRSRPDVIVAVGVTAAVPAKRATTSIPIVLAPVGDPIQTGLVPNLAMPGGNITGVSLYAAPLNQKRLEVLKEALPGTRRVGSLSNLNNPQYLAYADANRAAAEMLGLEVRTFTTRGVSDLESTFAAITREGLDALNIPTDAEFDGGREKIVRLVAEHRLPAIYEHRAFVDVGGLMSYGPDIDQMSYRAAAYVDKLLKGGKPGEMPIEQPTRFELIVNLKAARALSLDLAPTFLARADEVIE